MGANDEDGKGQESGTGTSTKDQESEGKGQGPAKIDLDTITDPALQAYVRQQLADAAEARKEAARHRVEARGLAAKVEEFERSKMTQQEKDAADRKALEADRDRLMNALAQRDTQDAVLDAAKVAQAISPSAIWKIIRDDVEIKDGKPTNIPALLAALKVAEPYLFRRVGADANAGNGTGGSVGASMNDEIRAALGRPVGPN